MIRPWPLIESRPIADHRIFRIRGDRKRSPRTEAALDFIVLECPDWVNVVAVTPRDELVMIEQYRHGSNTVELEIPGGMIDAEDPDPVAAGVRELREETGYVGVGARLLHSVRPNPAIMNNRCHTVLVESCEARHPVEFDQGEDLVTHLIPVGEVEELLTTGRISHSLVVVALLEFLRQRRRSE